MRNVFKIINTDAHRIFSSVVVLVILMGLCVVPSLYAWFNIFSNWDPYGQSATSRIRVAIADVDRGADLFGIQLEVGEQLVEGLQANKQIGWVFCESPEEALKRVYSGDCYAALVVPADFSKNIVSFMTLKFEHPTLVYYENGKKNAIAPKITGKAKTAVQETVNTTFLQTLADGAASVVSVLNANGLDAETTLQDLSKKLIDLSMELDNANAMLDSVAALADAASNLINASARLTSSMAGTVYLAADISADVGANVTEGAESAKSAVQAMGEAIALTNGSLSDFFQEVYAHTESQESLKEYLEGEYNKGVGQSLQEMQESTGAIADQLRTIPGLDGFADQMQDLSDRLGTLNTDLRTAVAEKDYSNLDGIRGAVNSVSGALGTLTQTATDASTMLGEWITNALSRIEIAAGNITTLLEAFGDAMVGLTYKLSSLSNSMTNVRTGILEAKEEIKRAQAKLLELADFLDALATSEFLQDVMEVLSSGGDMLDAHLASP
ncbi:MAG: YhgE/Pip family protein, partial [Oscillospiraceae bacterium]|nr:YhgE/Pip family protein [Oscillospiraceae bacterium]